MGQAEAPTDQKTVAEQAFDLLRRGVGADVEILRRASQQQIAHPAANQVGKVPGTLQTIENLQGVWSDSAS
jgi:hypothetical protein